ncbi:MAG: FHA domain-containing protein [Rhodoglobus sp.]
MTPDRDDTIISPARPQARSTTPDRDDTIIREAKHAPRKKRSYAEAAQYFRVQLDGSTVVYSLLSPCVFGRAPQPARIVRVTPPQLIVVASPKHEISETHLEIHQLGSSIVVTDLKSTNGSAVQMPGNVSQKLRQGESVVVSAGTLVDIGEGNIIRILLPLSLD